MLVTLPWETDIEPDFISDTGWEWYLDESSTKYLRKDNPVNGQSGVKDLAVFYVRKGEQWDWAIIDTNQQLIAVERSLDALGAKIDIIKTKRNFEQ